MNEKVEKVNNIILIGLTGSGKSSIGRYLSYILRLGFIDTDKEIEKNNKLSISEIFNTKGEAYFREQEKELIQSLIGMKHHIIVLGSGAVEHSMDIIKNLGYSIWIDIPINVIVQRFLHDKDSLLKRPLLKNIDNEKDLTIKLEELLTKRIDFYNKANYILKKTFYTPEIGAKSIFELLKEERIFC